LWSENGIKKKKKKDKTPLKKGETSDNSGGRKSLIFRGLGKTGGFHGLFVEGGKGCRLISRRKEAKKKPLKIGSKLASPAGPKEGKVKKKDRYGPKGEEKKRVPRQDWEEKREMTRVLGKGGRVRSRDSKQMIGGEKLKKKSSNSRSRWNEKGEGGSKLEIRKTKRRRTWVVCKGGGREASVPLVFGKKIEGGEKKGVGEKTPLRGRLREEKAPHPE